MDRNPTYLHCILAYQIFILAFYSDFIFPTSVLLKCLIVVTAVGISSSVVIMLKQVDKHHILRLSYYADKKGLTPLLSLAIIKKILWPWKLIQKALFQAMKLKLMERIFLHSNRGMDTVSNIWVAVVQCSDCLTENGGEITLRFYLPWKPQALCSCYLYGNVTSFMIYGYLLVMQFQNSVCLGYSRRMQLFSLKRRMS